MELCIRLAWKEKEWLIGHDLIPYSLHRQMLVLPQAVPLIARHSSKYMVLHSLCLVAFKSIILCEMTVTRVSSKSP